MRAYKLIGVKPLSNKYMTTFKGSTVLVTGGASGIGKLIGESCLYKGARRLIIWDIDTQALTQTARELKGKGYQVHAYQVDVSDFQDIESAAYTVLDDLGPVDILFNNAGIVVGKEFAEHTHEDIRRTVDINTSGVMHVALEFLPDMLRRKTGHIVNISSASGFLPNPKMSVYAASKWAVLGWSESLRLEMERGETGVKVTTVTPGYINTGMFDGVKAPFLTPILTPEAIVSQIMKAVEKEDILLRSPWIVNYLPMLRGMLPTRIFDRIAGAFGVYTSMQDFQGKQKAGPKAQPARKRISTRSTAKDDKKPQEAKAKEDAKQPEAAKA